MSRIAQFPTSQEQIMLLRSDSMFQNQLVFECRNHGTQLLTGHHFDEGQNELNSEHVLSLRFKVIDRSNARPFAAGPISPVTYPTYIIIEKA